MLLGRGATYLLIRAVFVMFYRAGANKDIGAGGRTGKEGQSGKMKNTFSSCLFVAQALSVVKKATCSLPPTEKCMMFHNTDSYL